MCLFADTEDRFFSRIQDVLRFKTLRIQSRVNDGGTGRHQGTQDATVTDDFGIATSIGGVRRIHGQRVQEALRTFLTQSHGHHRVVHGQHVSRSTRRDQIGDVLVDATVVTAIEVLGLNDVIDHVKDTVVDQKTP